MQVLQSSARVFAEGCEGGFRVQCSFPYLCGTPRSFTLQCGSVESGVGFDLNFERETLWNQPLNQTLNRTLYQPYQAVYEETAPKPETQRRAESAL